MSNGDPGLQLHLVDCIHAGVSYAVENGMNSEHACSSFSNYYQIHSLSFSEPLRKKIMESVAAIMKEFPNSSSNELDKNELQQLMGVRLRIV